MSATDSPQLTIIVPTRNEQRNLPRLLRSVNAQRGVDYEVIVVDQESDDATPDLARELGATIVTRPKPEFYSPPAQSRNVGAEHARGDYLLHLDADMELPDPDFLVRLMGLFDDDHQAVIIHETDVAEGWWNKVKAAERECIWDTPLESARGVSRKMFDDIGGYDPAISSGEDMHIQRQYELRTVVAKADDVWLRHHTGHIPLKRLLAKKYSYGRTSKEFLERSSAVEGHSASSWVVESLKAYATHLNVARKHPAAFACIIPLRVMELVAVRLGMRKAAKSA